ncbi:MAG: hypothetical protein FWC70_12490 [Defluviitaleaceae bacterium]|nr:hypothetical protein [Defluviitaleaceae bacterium]
MNKSALKQAAVNHPQKLAAPYDAILEQHGFDALFTVVEQMGGTTIYVPTIRSICHECIIEEARSEFKGSNLAAIARKYGFSERGLWNILKTS